MQNISNKKSKINIINNFHISIWNNVINTFKLFILKFFLDILGLLIYWSWLSNSKLHKTQEYKETVTNPVWK